MIFLKLKNRDRAWRQYARKDYPCRHIKWLFFFARHIDTTLIILAKVSIYTCGLLAAAVIRIELLAISVTAVQKVPLYS